MADTAACCERVRSCHFLRALQWLMRGSNSVLNSVSALPPAHCTHAQLWLHSGQLLVASTVLFQVEGAAVGSRKVGSTFLFQAGSSHRFPGTAPQAERSSNRSAAQQGLARVLASPETEVESRRR